jgi:HAE1 family hydrophobic/amphiphilic exporter-1
MQALAELCIRRPVFAAMMSLGLVILGLVSYSRLGVDRLPSVDVPTVRVRTTLPGAAPEDAELLLTDEIEEAVNTVEGLDELRSVSIPGQSNVIANFDLGRDVDAAAQDMRDRVAEAVPRLPEDTLPPTVSKVDNDSSPVLTLAVSGPRDPRELTEIADKLVRARLERAGGVGEIRLRGGLERSMNVWLDAARLEAYGVPVTAVRDAILAQNAEVPGGNLTAGDREVAVRSAGRLSDARGFGELTVATRDGVPLRVRDLGRAEDGTAEPRTLARLNGEPTVVLEVVRQSDANTIEVIEGVKRNLALLAPELPADVRVTVIRDQSGYIYAAQREISIHLIAGSILASAVVLLFMRNWRATLIAAIAIPTSVIATFAVMDALGFTLNSITMLALVLMVGIVIDDAIVVLENIFRFVEEKGMPPRQAAREATAEIGPAVLATTLSLVVIFLPVAFMSSVAGRFLYQFGVTAAVAVLVSLFVSFSLTPMMSSRLLAAGGGRGAGAPRSRGGFYARLDRGYARLIGWAMRRRAAVMLLAGGVIAAAVPIFARVGQEFVPADADESEFEIGVAAPEGASLAAMDEALREVERALQEVPTVRDVLVTSGGFAGTMVNSASVYVRIAPHAERIFSLGRLLRETLAGRPLAAFRGNASQSEVMTEVDRRLRQIPDLRCQVRNFASFNLGGGPFDVNLVLRGPELPRLMEYAEELRARGIASGGFRGLDTSLRLDKPELRVALDRERAADLGVSARDLGVALRLLVGGDEEVSRFLDPGTNEQYPVSLRLDAADRDRAELLDRLLLPAAGGALVEIGAVADVEEIESASRVDRLDRQRMIAVRGGVAPGFALGERLEALQGMAADLGMPQGYSVSLTGRSRELERTFDEFALAFLLSIVFMYLILASQFESLVHPFTILLSLPLAVPFALLALWATGGTLNMFSTLGILVLFGVVKKNSILQIDHMNALRRGGMERGAAILQGNRDRLRPILMTTLTLVAGMLPLAIGAGPGAEERRAVAVVVIGGQSLCLLLTLLVTPVAYSLFDDLALARRTRLTPTA